MEVDKELDPEQYHPLEDTWTLWFQKQHENGNTSALSWLEGLKEVMSFATVEEFWRMYNNIKTPIDMPPGTDYCLFKEGIEPKWEDPEHKVGGYFTVQLLGVEAEVFNKMWLHSLLACIGADFGHEEYETITGLYLSIRKKSAKISVWCRSPDQEQCERVGERFQELLDELNPSGKVNFNFLTHSPPSMRLQWITNLIKEEVEKVVIIIEIITTGIIEEIEIIEIIIIKENSIEIIKIEEKILFKINST